MIKQFNEKFQQVGLPFTCRETKGNLIVDFGNGRQTTLTHVMPYKYDNVLNGLAQLKDTPLVENIYSIDPYGARTTLNVNGHRADIDMMNMDHDTAQFAMFIPFKAKYQTTEEGITFIGTNSSECKLLGDLYYANGAENIQSFKRDCQKMVDAIKHQQHAVSDTFFKDQDSFRAITFTPNKTKTYDYDYKMVELHTLPDNQVGIKMSMDYEEMLDIPGVASMFDPNIANIAHDANIHIADQTLEVHAYAITDADNVDNEVERMSHAIDKKMETLQLWEPFKDVVITNDELLELSDAMEL